MTTPLLPDEHQDIPESPAGDGGVLPTTYTISPLEQLLTIVILPVVGLLLTVAFVYLKDEDANKALQVLVAIVAGSVGVWALYWGFDRLVSALPGKWGARIRPYVFIGPAMALLAFYLVYPAINTLIISFRDRDGETFVGFDNFERIFTESNYQISIRNSIAWVVLVPAVALVVGLAFATLADKLGRRAESVTKSMIFLPMVISFVGASVVFTFIWAFRAEGFGEQIGLLNGFMEWIGQDPVYWLQLQPWNNLFLMAVLVWLQTGFAMVILSSAIKGVPDELLEAARIDGATSWQVFYKIVLPSIMSTIVVVWTTILITVWKVFDIVFVTTGGRDGTQVVAQQMVREFFTDRNKGMGAALAVILFLAVTPILVLNVRRFRAQEAMR